MDIIRVFGSNVRKYRTQKKVSQERFAELCGLHRTYISDIECFRRSISLDNDLAEWDLNPIEPSALLKDFKRIIKPDGNIFVFTSYNLIGKWHEAFDSEFDTFQFFVWHKTNPAPKIFKNGFLNSCEMIACMWNKGHKWNFSTQNEMHNFFESPICMRPERLSDPKHPAQKPVKLLEHIIKIASNEGDVIFDPFMGVGSTGVAALKNNRKFIGIEIEQEYFSAAEKRLSEKV